MVYFITQGNEYVKIGYTNGVPNRRLGELQVGNPHELSIKLLLFGDDRMERAMHEQFKQYHCRGEWYYLSHELVEYIDSNIKSDLRLSNYFNML